MENMSEAEKAAQSFIDGLKEKHGEMYSTMVAAIALGKLRVNSMEKGIARDMYARSIAIALAKAIAEVLGKDHTEEQVNTFTSNVDELLRLAMKDLG